MDSDIPHKILKELVKLANDDGIVVISDIKFEGDVVALTVISNSSKSSCYKETLEQLSYQEYFMNLLDYNNFSLELSTRTEDPSLEEEAMLHTMEQKLKDQADVLGIVLNFPSRPQDPTNQD